MILIILFFIFAAVAESVMDTLQFHYHNSIFKLFKNVLFWNPEISWKNKYKNGNPLYGEKFLFSKTLLVGLTDGWHLFKLMRNFSLFFGVFLILNLTYNIWLSVLFSVILRIIYGVVFTLFYSYIFEKKNK
jgi:hypothetical protein